MIIFFILNGKSVIEVVKENKKEMSSIDLRQTEESRSQDEDESDEEEEFNGNPFLKINVYSAAKDGLAIAMLTVLKGVEDVHLRNILVNQVRLLLICIVWSAFCSDLFSLQFKCQLFYDH